MNAGKLCWMKAAASFGFGVDLVLLLVVSLLLVVVSLLLLLTG